VQGRRKNVDAKHIPLRRSECSAAARGHPLRESFLAKGFGSERKAV